MDADFTLAIAPIRDQITVAATPAGEAMTFEAFNSIQSFDAVDIAPNASADAR